MATDHHGPRKVGVYEGVGTIRSQSRSFLWIVALVVVAALLLVWLH
ncbi:hypothetical protein [Azospirillum sp. TSO22-1]|nr:hypothetical protein [Azospirillum sp. TSO22-1]